MRSAIAKLAAGALALTGAAAFAFPAAAALVGKDAEVCAAGRPSAQVRVSGLKRPTGTVRVTLYDPGGWLKKGQSLRKVRVPVSGQGPLDICVAVPGPGRYAVAVHHDLNGNGDRDTSDGGGYSRNPRVTLTSLKPRFQATAFEVGGAPALVPVQLLYMHGLTIGPARS